MNRALGAVLALVVVLPGLSARAADDRATDLKAVHDDVMRQIREKEIAYEREQEKLKKTKKQAVDLAKREKQLLKRLEEADRSLARTRVELALLDKQIEWVKADIRLTQEKLDTESALLLYRRQTFNGRLRTAALYGGRADWMGRMLLPEDLSADFQTWEGLSGLVEMDRAFIREIHARRTGLEAGLALLAAQERNLLAIQTEKAQLSKKQERDLAQRQKLFDEVKSRRSAMDELARQIESDAANMDILLNALRDQVSKLREKMAYLRKEFESKKGFLRWPVARDGVRTVLPFGRVFDESIQEWRVNKGIDIWTGTNQSVLAVGGGEVVFADFLGRMGNMVVLSHGGDFFTLYAHLAEISAKLGDKIEDGGVLGKAGNTGRLGSDPVLHFEVRQGGSAVDPAHWLRRRE